MSMQAKNKWEWMVEAGKECNSHPFTSPQKMDGIPQFPSKICGVLDGYHPFEDGYPSLPSTQITFAPYLAHTTRKTHEKEVKFEWELGLKKGRTAC